MNALVETLSTLRDIKGIQGSFVVHADDGRLLARELPAIIDDATLTQIGPRIGRLLHIVDAQPPTESIALRFGDQRLDVKRVGSVLLCVLTDVHVSPPALRMAIKLVGRKLESHNWTSVPVASDALAAPAPADPATQRRTVQFRGIRGDL